MLEVMTIPGVNLRGQFLVVDPLLPVSGVDGESGSRVGHQDELRLLRRR